MKTPRISSLIAAALVLGAVLSSAVAADDDLLPQPYPASRYDALCKKSPFTLSSVADETVNQGFASKLYLTGILKLGKDSYASVVDKDSKQRFLISSQPNEQNIRLVSVESADDLGKVVVVLKKGDETAQLKYDFDALKQLQPVAAAAPGPSNGLTAPIPAPVATSTTIQQTPPPVTRRFHRPVVLPSRAP